MKLHHPLAQAFKLKMLFGDTLCNRHYSGSFFKMASDIDPILVRALNLLHSKHPKALEQLCALRDEVLGKKPEYVPEVWNKYVEQKSVVHTDQYFVNLRVKC